MGDRSPGGDVLVPFSKTVRGALENRIRRIPAIITFASAVSRSGRSSA